MACDIKLAYCLLPVHPSDRHLLGILWQGSYLFDKRRQRGSHLHVKYLNPSAPQLNIYYSISFLTYI